MTGDARKGIPWNPRSFSSRGTDEPPGLRLERFGGLGESDLGRDRSPGPRLDEAQEGTQGPPGPGHPWGPLLQDSEFC